MAALSKYIPQNGTAGQYLAGGSVANFARTDAFSVSFWVRITEGGAGEIYLMGSSLSSASNEKGWQITHVDAGSSPPNPSAGEGLRFIFGNNVASDRLIITSRFLVPLVWYFCVLTYDGSSSPSGAVFYVNGYEAETTNSIGSITASTDDPAAVFQIGDGLGSALPAPADFFSVALWDTALSAAQVLELYNNEVPLNPTDASFAANLIGGWQLNPQGNWPEIPPLQGVTNLIATGAWTASDPSTRESPPNHIGEIFAWDQAGLSQFIATGLSMSFATGPPQINVTNPNGNFAGHAVIADNSYTCPDRWSITMEFVIDGGAAFVGGFGFIPTEVDDDGTLINKGAAAFIYNAPSGGVVSIHLAQRDLLDATPARAASTGGSPASASDVIRLTAIRSGNILTVSAFNVTSPTTADPPGTTTHYATQSVVSGAWDEPPATGEICLYVLAGAMGVRSLTVNSKDIKNPCFLFLGDSITQGVAVGGTLESNGQRWVELAQAQLNTNIPKLGGSTSVSAGGGDRIASAQAKIASGDLQKYFDPSAAGIIATPLGGNDTNRSVTYPVIEAEHAQMVQDLLQLDGVKAVLILNISPLNGDPLVPTLNAYFLTQNQQVVDIYSALVGTPLFLATGLGSGDGTHLNATGMSVYANTVEEPLLELALNRFSLFNLFLTF